MAVIHLTEKYNFKNAEAWPWTVTEHNATTLTIAGGPHEMTMTGEYVYDGENVSGVVNSATYYANDNLVFNITDINRSADLLHGALELVQMTGEAEILLAYIFGGDDQMYGRDGKDVITGYDGNDYISGAGGSDFLAGNVGNDVIDGGAGDDDIRGGYGDDILNGGAGDNLIFSGLGHDTIVIDNRGAGIDTIAGFEQGADVIELGSGVGMAFRNLGSDGALNADFFAANASGTAGDANDYIVYNTTTGALSYDADGSGAGAAVQFAVVGSSTHPALTAADFAVDAV